jgi:hypothetical protein
MIKHKGYYLLPLMLLVPKVSMSIEWNSQNLPLTTILAAGVVQSDANGDLFTSTTINASGLNLETLAVSGTSNLSGTVTAGGAVNVAGPLNVTGAETVGGTLTTLGTVNVAGPLNVTGAETVGGTLTTLGTVNVAGPLNVTGAETVGGTLTTLGTVNVAGPLNVTGATNLTGLVTTLAGVNTAGPLNVTGSVNVGGVISASSGTNLAPSITFIGDTDTGFFRDGDGIMGVTSNGTTQFSVSPNLINVASGTKFQANGTVDVVGPLNVTGTTDLRGQVKMSGLVDLGTAISVDMGVYPDATFFKVTPATAALSISGSAPAGRIVFIFNATGVPITIDVPGSPDGTIPSGDVGAVVVVPGEGWKNFG